LRSDFTGILRQAGAILFDKFDRRYKEGLTLILRGAKTAKMT
jgi:TetR/AcrR family transcriptional regulator, tetracycline repressor protein